MNNKVTKKGFTILIAVVAASVLLIVAMTIADIALKEQILASAGRDSQIAFYAADTGIECALYWDQKQGIFSNVDQNGNAVSFPLPDGTNSSGKFRCNGNKITNVKNPNTGATLSSIPGGNAPVMFEIDNLSSSGACAVVVIQKNRGKPINAPSSTGYDPNKVYTTVDSRGYNTCNASLRRLERGILATY